MLWGTPNAPRVWDTRIHSWPIHWWNWYNNVLQLFYFMLWEQVFLLIFFYIYKFDITRRSQQKWTILLFATLTKYNFMFRWFRFRCSLVLMHIVQTNRAKGWLNSELNQNLLSFNIYFNFFFGRNWLVCPHFFLRQFLARGGRRA